MLSVKPQRLVRNISLQICHDYASSQLAPSGERLTDIQILQALPRFQELGLISYEILGEQYTNFGDDIQHLAENLDNLGKVIQDVTKEVPSFYAQENKWNLKTISKICGDFERTLNDCQEFLADKSKFSRDREGFIYNIQWDLLVKPEVTRLKDRVAFHSIKVKWIRRFGLL